MTTWCSVGWKRGDYDVRNQNQRYQWHTQSRVLSVTRASFTIIQDGNLAGFDIELPCGLPHLWGKSMCRLIFPLAV